MIPIVMVNIKKEFYEYFDNGNLEFKINEAIIVFDTNTLMNLYRYSKENRNKLLEIMDSVKNRIVLTNQIAFELLKNRKTEIKKRNRYKNKIKTTVKEWSGSFIEKLNADDGVKRILDNEKKLSESLRKKVHICSQELETIIKDFDEKITDEYINPEKDVILESILNLFDNNVLEKLSNFDEVVKEGFERIRKEIPPGFKDEYPGDYIIWTEMKCLAKQRNKDILFISNDMKEDWMETKNSIYPKTLLLKEFKNETGFEFWKIKVEEFISRISDIKKIHDTSSLQQETEQINKSLFSNKNESDYVVINMDKFFTNVTGLFKIRARISISFRNISIEVNDLEVFNNSFFRLFQYTLYQTDNRVVLISESQTDRFIKVIIRNRKKETGQLTITNETLTHELKVIKEGFAKNNMEVFIVNLDDYLSIEILIPNRMVI